MTEWRDDLEHVHELVWRLLERGVADRRAAARHPVLATTGAEGGAEARVVVLRAASREDAILEVHTDSASAKIGELSRVPRASLLVWDQRAHLQIRIRADVEIRKGLGAAQVWRRVPEHQREVYGVHPPPGTEIIAPDAFAPGADPDRFAVLTARARELDVVYLGQDGHRRARYAAADNWHGCWLAP